MSVNLVVWAWSEEFDTPAKRKKRQLKFADIKEAWSENGDHPCMAPFDFAPFEAAVVEKLGPQKTEGPYILTRYPRSLCYDLPLSRSDKLVPEIGTIARRFGLNAAAC